MTIQVSREVGSDRRALVTGSTGYLGARLAERLEREGREVHLLVRPGSETRVPRGLRGKIHVDEPDRPLTALVRSIAPDTCFHLAGYFVGSHREEDVGRLVHDNVLFGARLADALASIDGAVLVSTGTYWQNAGSQPYRPVALYAATKQALQDVLQYYAERGLLRIAQLKLFETYGPYDPRPKLLNLLLQAAASGEELGISPGGQFIDLVHVDDVVDAFLAAESAAAVDRAADLRSYAVSSGEPMTVRTLVERVGRIIGRPVPVRLGERDYRWREMMQPWDVGDPPPGWRAQVSLDCGLRSLWETVSRGGSPESRL